MGYVIEVLQSMWQILEQFVPNGIDPTMFWLSFILVTSITYLLLSLIHLFKGKNGVTLLVSVIIGYFAAGSAFSTIFLATFFPNLTVGLFVMLGVLMVFAMILPGKTYKGFVWVAVIVLFVVIFGTWQGVSSSLGMGGPGSGSGSGQLVPGMTPDDWAALILIIFVIAVFVIATKPKSNTKKPPFYEVLDKYFGKMNP